MNQPFPMHHFHPLGCRCSSCCPPCPPPPACCPPPGCVDQMQACWDSSQALYALVKKVLQDVIASEPGLLTPTGVTDGSNVQPGQVGEFISFLDNFPIPATINFHQVIAVGTLPPGDWDCEARIECDSLVGGLDFFLNPVPDSASNGMETRLGIWVSATEAGMMDTIMSSPVCRINNSAPVLVTFEIVTNYLTSPVLAPEAGTGSIIFGARRMR